MVSLETPVCEFNLPAPDFLLPGVDGKEWSLQDCCGEKGLVVMFICNHCPYVKAILARIVRDTAELRQYGINSVAIMSNDPTEYTEDSFDNMQNIARQWHFSFPYLWDKEQSVAKQYGAVCTPDFFGYNQHLQLQYRGRLDASRKETAPDSVQRELFLAMQNIAKTGQGPKEQIPSMGCSIKWYNGGR